MAGDYNVVSTGFFAGTQDWPDDERLVGLYLLTCEARRTEGLFKIPVPIAAYELGGDAGTWTTARVEKAFRALSRRGWLVREGVWVCIAKALSHKFNRPQSPSAIKGALGQVETAPRDGEVWAAFVAGAERWCPDLADVIAGRKTIERDGKRGLYLAVAQNSPTTPPPTTPVSGPVLPQSDAVLSHDKGNSLGSHGGSTSSTSLSTSNSNSISTSLPAASAAPGSSREAGGDPLDLLVESICSAALRGPSEVLRAQAVDPAARVEVRAQLEIAGPKATAAAGHVADWVARRNGKPLRASSLSFLVRSAAAKVPDQGLFASTEREPLSVVRSPASAEAVDLWALTLAEVSSQVDDSTYELYLEALQPIDLTGTTLVVGGAPEIVEWVRLRCSAILDGALLVAAGRPFGLELRGASFDREEAA